MPEKQLRMIRRNLDGLPECAVPEGYALRTYQPGDEQAWCDIMNTGLGSGWTVERCQQQLTAQGRFRPGALYFAACDGQPVGSACVWPDSPDDRSRAQVHMVCVMPEHRSKRLGHLLTLAVLHHMKDHGFQSAYLLTDDDRVPAIKTYLQLGFEPDYVEESHRLRWAQIFSRIGQIRSWWRHVRPEPPSYGIRETAGNLPLLIVLDHARPEAFERARRTIIAAFNHYGMPYRALDLATTREPSQAITHYQAIVLAQECLGDSLSGTLAKQMARAVAEGAGFISFDHRIDRYPDALRPLIPATPERTMHEAAAITVPTGNHFIVENRPTERQRRLRRPVELTCAVTSSSGRVIAETSEQMPALLTGRYGDGKTVQYLVGARIWDQAYFGHGEGLDDIFWRSIVWAARKPFVMKAMPAYVTVRIDHATGAADGFAYLHTLVNRGWCPHVGFLSDRMSPAEWRTLTRLADSGQVECFPQAFSEHDGLYFDDTAGASSSGADIASSMERLKTRLEEYGTRLARSFNPDQGAYGRHVIPFLIGQGVQYSLSPYLPDEASREAHLNWEPAPYGHPGFIMDRLPGYPGLFVVTASPVSCDRAGEPEDRQYRLISAVQDDFLEPAFRTSRTMNIVDKAMRTARGGLGARFYGVITLEESDILDLTGDERETVLDHLDHLVREYEATKLSQDDIGRYARSKVESHVAHASFDPATQELHIVLAGQADIPLQIQIFDEDCLERTVMMDRFDGRLEEHIRYD